MNIGILYAVLAAIFFGLWTVFHDQVSTRFDTLFGAVMISGIGAVIGLLFLLPKLGSLKVTNEPKAWLWLSAAGVAFLEGVLPSLH